MIAPVSRAVAGWRLGEVPGQIIWTNRFAANEGHLRHEPQSGTHDSQGSTRWVNLGLTLRHGIFRVVIFYFAINYLR